MLVPNVYSDSGVIKQLYYREINCHLRVFLPWKFRLGRWVEDCWVQSNVASLDILCSHLHVTLLLCAFLFVSWRIKGGWASHVKYGRTWLINIGTYIHRICLKNIYLKNDILWLISTNLITASVLIVLFHASSLRVTSRRIQQLITKSMRQGLCHGHRLSLKRFTPQMADLTWRIN